MRRTIRQPSRLVQEHLLDDAAAATSNGQQPEESKSNHRAHHAAPSFFSQSSIASKPVPAPVANAPSASTPVDALGLRQQYDLHLVGANTKSLPPPIQSFDELQSLHPSGRCLPTLLHNLHASGYHSPTPIQAQIIALFLQTQHELLACAPTGSGKCTALSDAMSHVGLIEHRLTTASCSLIAGKTLAYVIPLLLALNKPVKTKGKCVRSVILTPTRELATQIHRVITSMLLPAPGSESKPQKWRVHVLTKELVQKELPASIDILITTPLRLISMIKHQSIDCSTVEYLIMDEADRLFELGFLQQVDDILVACTHTKLKRHLYSATMVQGVETLARSILRQPIRCTVGARNAAAEEIDQQLMFVGTEDGKLVALRQLMHSGLPVPMLIFVQSKDRAKQLYAELVYEKVNVDAIHSDRTTEQRNHAIEQFRSGKTWVLICTDILSRGIDFLHVNCVINYDMPSTTVNYIHRIGRCGRAGRAGKAITLFTEADRSLIRNIAAIVQHSGSSVPEWMLRLPKVTKKRGAILAERGVARQPISKDIQLEQKQHKQRDETKKAEKKNNKRKADSDTIQAGSATPSNGEAQPAAKRQRPQSDNSTKAHSKSTAKSKAPHPATQSPSKQSVKAATADSNSTILSNDTTTNTTTPAKHAKNLNPKRIARAERRYQMRQERLKQNTAAAT